MWSAGLDYSIDRPNLMNIQERSRAHDQETCVCESSSNQLTTQMMKARKICMWRCKIVGLDLQKQRPLAPGRQLVWLPLGHKGL